MPESIEGTDKTDGDIALWRSLADLEEEDRQREMHTRYEALVAMDEEERRRVMRSMAEVEYGLNDDTIRPFQLSRLRVWLLMEPASAQTLGASYDAVLDQMPGDIALRRVGLAQSLMKSFSTAEQAQLRAVLPRVFGDRGTATANWGGNVPAEFTARPAPRKRWWAFWAS
jgi:hypothetical protein